MKEISNSGKQYGNFKGDVAIDGFSDGNLHKFSKKNGINTDKYIPIGIDLYLGSNNHVNIDIITIDENNFNSKNSSDALNDYFDKNETIDVKKFNLPNVKLEDYLKYCNKFTISATTMPKLIGKKMNII